MGRRPGIRVRPGVFLVAVLALVAALLPVSSDAAATAEPAGSWQPATPPIAPVSGAVLLADGKVLASRGACCSFELYDPVLNVWQPVAPLPADTANTLIAPPRLTALEHPGHALVTFSVQPSTAVQPKYRYNGKYWVQLPRRGEDGFAEPNHAQNYTTTLLDHPDCDDPPAGFDYPCGEVLIGPGITAPPAGTAGHGADGRWRAVLYSYDVNDPDDRGQLRETGSIPRTYCTDANEPLCGQRAGHLGATTSLLDDGRVVVAGGSNTLQVDIYDPGSGTWSPAADMPENAGGPWALRLMDGRVLFGGWEAAPVIFDPRAGDADPVSGKPRGTWTTVGNCEAAFECGFAVVLPDGKVMGLTAPDVTEPDKPTKTFVFDPSNPGAGWVDGAVPDVPTRVSAATVLRGGPEACRSNCGNVFAAGQGAYLYQLLNLEGISPAQGLSCGGDVVTLSGSGLGQATAVNFGATAVQEFTFNDADGTITVVAPPNRPGVVPVTVSTPAGTSKPVEFTYIPTVAGTIGTLSKSEGPARGGTVVKIGGTFPPACVKSVRFGAAEATINERDRAAGTITVTNPGGSPGETVPVTVDVYTGPPLEATLPSTPLPFKYRELPAIDDIEPPRASALGGSVTITGTGFDHDEDVSQPRVTFDGRASKDVTVVNAETLRVKAPRLLGANASSNVPVTVETDARGASLPSGAFAYHPGVSSIFPSGGLITGGESRTVTGAGLFNADRVLIGGQEAKILERVRSADGDALVVSTPARAEPESVPVQVVAAGLTSLETIFFSYGQGPPVQPPGGDPDPGPTNRPQTTPQAAPPGGTGSPAPSPGASASPTPTPSPVPGASSAAGASGAGAGSSSAASAQGSAGQASSPAGAGAAGAAAAPAPGPAAAPASAAAGTGSGGPAGAGSDDEADEARTMPRHNMTAANIAMGLGGAGAAMCFSGLALARRRRAARSRPRPRGAY